MAAEPKPAQDERRTLNRERVLLAAMELADEGGIESLSMRKLGQALGVEAMSLYNHVANKEDLIFGLLDLVDGEIDIPGGDEDWKTSVRSHAISAHDAMIRHRWSCPLMLSTGPEKMRTARLRHMEALLGALHQAGFSVEVTYHAYHAIESHIMGFTLWQVSVAAHMRKATRPLAQSLLMQISEEEFPHTLEHGRQHLSGSAPSAKEEFEFGLDLILDGIERLRGSEEHQDSAVGQCTPP